MVPMWRAATLNKKRGDRVAQPICKDTLRSDVRHCMAAGKIDLAQFGPNTLRHVTASYLVAGGIPPAAIMSRAGWTSYSTFLKFYNLQMANNNWSTMIIQAAGMQGEVVGSGSCPSTTATLAHLGGLGVLR